MWSPDFILGIIVAILCLVVGLALIAQSNRMDPPMQAYHDDVRPWLGGIGLAIVILTIVVTVGAMFPYERQYHSFNQQGGVVEAVESRLVKVGDGMEEKFVVRFVGVDPRFGCKDTRCSLVQPGDTLYLNCIRDWSYTGTDGWDCSFREHISQAP